MSNQPEYQPRTGSWVIARIVPNWRNSRGWRPSPPALSPHPGGDTVIGRGVLRRTAETFAGRVHVEWGQWRPCMLLLGQLPFFIEYLKQAGLFDGWVADCPLRFSSPNAPSKRDLLGTLGAVVGSGGA